MQPDTNQDSSIDSTKGEASVTQASPAAPQQSQQSVAPAGSWQFTGGASTQDAESGAAEAAIAPGPAAPESVEWTASEYAAHDKSATWFMALAIIAAVLTAAVFFLTGHDIVSSIVVPIVAVMFGYSAARRPQVRRFSIDNRGIAMGSRFHPFSQLKSFTVSGEGAIRSIMIMPLKRYMPPVSMYYPPDQEEQIMEVLSQYLPFEPERHDNVERVMRRIKF